MRVIVVANVWLIVVAGSVLGILYPYVGYPTMLKILSLVRRLPPDPQPLSSWPTISIVVPVFNEENAIRHVLEQILQLDYPEDRRQIVVVSDASTDSTDDIVSEFASSGVELLRLPQRSGKTAAQNAALGHLHSEIVMNVDASVRFTPRSLKALIAPFACPWVGVTSCRDISVSPCAGSPNLGELSYVRYEMWLRKLETRVEGIVGASGCFFASRRALYAELIPGALSRDFATPLIAREAGYRSVLANEAICYVPRTGSLRREYKRKVRTMSCGLMTLFYYRRMLNPFRYGLFAWILFTHKLARWLVPWAVVMLMIGMLNLAASHQIARWALAGVGLLVLVTLAERFRPLPNLLSIATYGVAGIVAGLHAWAVALSGKARSIWEPT